MKRTLTTILLTLSLLPLFAQGRSGFQVGLQGGINTRFDNDRPALGFGGNVDIRYVYFADLSLRSQLGFQIGVGAEWTRSALHRRLSAEQDVMTYNRQSNGQMTAIPVHYTLTAEADYTDQQLALSVPIRMALRLSGVSIDLGPTLHFPLRDSYALSLSSGTVDAYFPQYGVHVVNDPTMGVFPATGTDLKGDGVAPRMTLSLGGAIGYEWRFGRQSYPRAYSHYAAAATEHRLTIQVVADYPVWQNSTFTLPPVSIIASAAAMPPVSLPELSRPLTIGLRVAYSLFPSTQSRRFPCSCSR